MARPRVLLRRRSALLSARLRSCWRKKRNRRQVSDGRALVAAPRRSNRMSSCSTSRCRSERARRGTSGEAEVEKREARVLDDERRPRSWRRGVSGGASAYILKRSAASELATAIREVMHGRSYVTPLITADLMQSLQHVDVDHRAHADAASARSVQLRRRRPIDEGDRQVLNVTPRTVAFTAYKMMEQLKITSTAELVQYAVKQHLVRACARPHRRRQRRDAHAVVRHADASVRDRRRRQQRTRGARGRGDAASRRRRARHLDAGDDRARVATRLRTMSLGRSRVPDRARR